MALHDPACREGVRPDGARAAETFLLTVSCPDAMGIVADVANFLFQRGCNIIDSAQFGDAWNGRFFLRMQFVSTAGVGLEELRRSFASTAAERQMEARFFDVHARTRTVILVSKFGHCLNDLIFRWQTGALPIDIAGIVSNHAAFKDTVERAGLPFLHVPVTPETKSAQMDRLGATLVDLAPELIVLARYMQVLPPDLCRRYSGRIINIHHSFLPSFKGARPYDRAHERGVKLIGATAHYVTDELDEGPIIEQQVERVNHSQTVDDYIAVGRDVETVVLARAIKWHAEHRVFLNGRRTVLFH